MGLTASDKGGGDFTPAPEGTHIARCVRVIDLGTQPGSQQFPKPKHKVLIFWELPEVTEEYEGKMTPRLVGSRYTMSLHENSALRPILESWRSRAFTPTELEGFELRNILGVPCLLTVVHSEDGKYANIKSVSALHPKLRADMPEAHHDLVYYEIEDGPTEAFEKFSANLKSIICAAPEWTGDEAGKDGDQGFGDDDIPFDRSLLAAA